MVEFYKTKTPIGEQEIIEIEKLLDYSFPDEYRNHLLKYNGGRCKSNVFSFIENNKKTESQIDWFLAIYDGKYNNLQSYIDIYIIEQRRLPEYFVPIAHDPGGNLICIASNSGFIYFWDHEKEGEDNVYFISDSFNHFIDNLSDN
jgi:hypothetical protein